MPTNAIHANAAAGHGNGDVHVHGEPMLDAERLDVYRAVEFQVLAATLARGADAVLRDQLLRASVSIVLNLAEGAGRRSRRDKARFYFMARGSAAESGAILYLLRARGLAGEAEYSSARRLVIRIVQMLSRLAVRTR